jgi:hypothetical protein
MSFFTINCSTINTCKSGECALILLTVALLGLVPLYGAVDHNIRSICCGQSTVTMRFRAGLTSSKLAPFPRSGTTSRALDSEYLFGAEFLFHDNRIFRSLCAWMTLPSFLLAISITCQDS